MIDLIMLFAILLTMAVSTSLIAYLAVEDRLGTDVVAVFFSVIMLLGITALSLVTNHKVALVVLVMAYVIGLLIIVLYSKSVSD